MSNEAPSFWLKLTEKIVGAVVLILGIVLIYLTATSVDTLLVFSWLFGVLGTVLIIVGIVVLIAKLPE